MVPTSRILYSLATSAALHAERAAQRMENQAVAARRRRREPDRRGDGVAARVHGEEVAQGAGVQYVNHAIARLTAGGHQLVEPTRAAHQQRRELQRQDIGAANAAEVRPARETKGRSA